MSSGEGRSSRRVAYYQTEEDPYLNRDRLHDPYREFLAAILYRALVDASCPTKAMAGESYSPINDGVPFKGKINQAEAISWLNDSCTEPWSFQWICDCLDIEPHIILSLIKTDQFKKGRIYAFYRPGKKNKKTVPGLPDDC